jgi:hypothetical protein
MLRNIKFHLKLTILLMTTLSYFMLTDPLLLGESWLYDCPSRTISNDASLHFSYLYWTTLTYLGPFFLAHLYTILVYFNFVKLSVIIFVNLLYTSELSDFILSNVSLGPETLNFWNFNNLLTNNLNKYHPHIFYLSSAIFLVYLFISSCYMTYPYVSFNLTYWSEIFWNVLKTSTWLNLTALFLGSWWAFQEGTWGGWWNWDPSEVLGLVIFLTNLLILHVSLNHTTFVKSIYKGQLGAWLLATLYFFTQLNFDLVSHNFGNRFTFFFNNTLFYLEGANYTFCMLIGVFVRWGWTQLHYHTYTCKRPQALRNVNIRATLSLLWSSIILFSFLPLINYFLWQYFYINAFNTLMSYQLNLYLSLVALNLVFNSGKYHSHPHVTWFLVSWLLPNFYFNFFLKLNHFKATAFVHLLILSLILLNYTLNEFVVATPYSATPSRRLVWGHSLWQPHYKIFLCEGLWRETYTYSVSTGNLPMVSYQLSSFSNVPETNPFNLYQNSSSFWNTYQLTSSYITTNLIIDNPLFSNLYDSLILTILFFVIFT